MYFLYKMAAYNREDEDWFSNELKCFIFFLALGSYATRGIIITTSGQSNLTTGRIAAAHGRF